MTLTVEIKVLEGPWAAAIHSSETKDTHPNGDVDKAIELLGIVQPGESMEATCWDTRELVINEVPRANKDR